MHERAKKLFKQFLLCVAFHIETKLLGLQYKSNSWFNYERQQWVEIIIRAIFCLLRYQTVETHQVMLSAVSLYTRHDLVP